MKPCVCMTMRAPNKTKTCIIFVYQEPKAVSDSEAVSVAVWWQDGMSDVSLGTVLVARVSLKAIEANYTGFLEAMVGKAIFHYWHPIFE